MTNNESGARFGLGPGLNRVVGKSGNSAESDQVSSIEAQRVTLPRGKRGEVCIEEKTLQMIDRLIKKGHPTRKVETPIFDLALVGSK